MGRQYFSAGFKPLVSPNNVSMPEMPVKAATSVARGVVIGYVTGAVALDAFSSNVVGVSAVAKDNSSGALGALKVPFLPINQDIVFIVPVSNALATVAAKGTIVDITTGGAKVDLSDTTVVNYGFKIEDIDVSTEAVAANTYGFVIGRIVTVST